MTSAAEWINYSLRDEKLTYEDLVRLVQVAQRALGAAPDGKPGAHTLEALRRHLQAVGDVADLDAHGTAKAFTAGVPKGRAAGHRLYGKPAWTRPDPEKRRVELDKDWVRKNIRRFELHNGDYVNLHRLVGAEFVRLFQDACEKSGYEPSTQSWNPRTIGLSDRLSWHAVGAAVDFSPGENGWGDKDSEVARHPKFCQVFRDAGWSLGLDWSPDYLDPMHFQRVG